MLRVRTSISDAGFPKLSTFGSYAQLSQGHLGQWTEVKLFHDNDQLCDLPILRLGYWHKNILNEAIKNGKSPSWCGSMD